MKPWVVGLALVAGCSKQAVEVPPVELVVYAPKQDPEVMAALLRGKAAVDPLQHLRPPAGRRPFWGGAVLTLSGTSAELISALRARYVVDVAKESPDAKVANVAFALPLADGG